MIVVMLIAVLLTVVLSLSFTAKTETQLTKLEEENQKALAAAEAGIEAALKQGTPIADFSTLNVPQGFTGSADVQPTTGTEFATPLVQKDGQYSFYATSFDNEAKRFSGASYVGNLKIYYNSDSVNKQCDSVSLEITMISGNAAPYTITRKIVDSGDKLTSSNTDDLYDSSNSSGDLVDGITFYCSTKDFSVASNTKIVLVRVLFKQEGTRVGFKGLSGDLKSQGTVIISEAKSPIGVSKKIRLFQSYPQIPADFFVSSF